MKKFFIITFFMMLLFIVGCTKEVVVTFDSDGGTPIASVKVMKGSVVEEPQEPVRGDDKFVGWFYNDSEWDFSNPVNEDMTLVAEYVEATKLKVVFYDNDGNILKTEYLEEGESATAPTAPEIAGLTFVGWDVDFTNVTSDLEVRPIYDDGIVEFTVTFLDYNGKSLKEEIVKQGENATAPSDPSRDGYLFMGWSVSFENVQSNLVVRAEYLSKDLDYNIKYNMNNGIWGFTSKNEMVLYFLKDFYKFVNPSENEIEFVYGTGNGEFLGTWKNYIGGSVGTENKLLYENNLDLDNDEYFFNSSQYKQKWGALGRYVATLNGRFNGNDYHYGALDFYRYIIDNPDQYIDIYGEEFYGFPKINEPFTTYKYSETNITLPRPLKETFKGWYTNSDFSGEPIAEIPAHSMGEIEIFACWDTALTYEVSFDSDGAGEFEPITVVFEQEVDLPTGLTKEGYTFVGWYLNEKFIGEKLVFTYPFSFTLKARWRSNTVTLEELKYNGSAVKYRNTNTAVEIPSDYVQPKEQLRATWVTSFASTFSPSPVEATMKYNLTEVLNLLEEYNMNCMIFHIRTTNNAFYPTDLAPISSAYGTKESFEEWDYLEWLIDECHKRGIEFHAWLNPYRIKAYGYTFDATEETVAAQYANYPLNPASDPENILMTYRSDGTQGAILNPYEEEVQDYIVDVCLEVMEKYDVDAIHFDDYFYAQMSSGISVLNEPDQDDYEEFIKNNPNCGYSKSNANHKKQWRRDNIDKFIYKLHVAMTDFNKENGRGVQLGISPTGIYRNGNGSVESGSNTAGQEHYSSYLFCDTMNWVRNEWIDYIMPQTYWAFTHKVAGYADVLDWWDKAVDGTRVNLYSGLGLYMSISGGNYSWGVQPYEISNQVLYTTKLKNVKGVSIYSQLSLGQGNSSSSRICYEGLMRLKNEYWNQKVETPKTMAHQYIK